MEFPTSSEVKRFPRKNLTINEALALLKKFSVPITKKKLSSLPNGTFLAVHKAENGRMVRLHLKTIYMRTFDMNYRTTKTKDGQGRKEKELLISSVPLPKGKIL